MQEKCYNTGSGEGVRQLQTLQKRPTSMETRRYEEIEADKRHQRKTKRFDGIRMNQHCGKKSAYSSVFSRILSVFPVFPFIGIQEKIYRKIGSKKVGTGTLFTISNRRKTEERKEKRCDWNSSKGETKATEIHSRTTD